MRSAFLAAGLAAFILSCGGDRGGNLSPSDVPRATFKVMTFNIQHGLDASGKYGLQRAIDAIRNVNPDLVGVQELTRNHPYYNCEDQPALIAKGLSDATGRPWSHVYVQEWFTPDRQCEASGRGDGRETEGLGFFAPLPLGPAQSVPLWNSALGLAVTLPGTKVRVVVTHLASQAVRRPDRVKQLEQLLPWAASLGSPRILLGDFNADPDSPELQPVLAGYADSWAEGVARGVAGGAPGGVTHKTVRIDYIFYAPRDAFELVSAETVETRPWLGVEASDHRPVVAVFRLR